jgi:CheY-like chemotaxis protein
MVDDNSMGLLARKAVLEELGFKVTTVATPQEALECLSATKFDLLITDYKLPSMTGTELIKRMRKLDVNCPVILLSGFVEALGLDGSNTGADIVLQKSAHEVSHMVRSVKSLLKRGAAKKPAASDSPTIKQPRKKA